MSRVLAPPQPALSAYYSGSSTPFWQPARPLRPQGGGPGILQNAITASTLSIIFLARSVRTLNPVTNSYIYNSYVSSLIRL